METTLNTVLADKLTNEGITPVTLGAVLGSTMREGLKQFLKTLDPSGYAEYRKLKDVGTPEAKIAATKFLFDRTRDLLLVHYTPTPAKKES
jgi:hypothetical protein